MDICLGHLPAHFDQRLEHLVHLPCTEQQCADQQEKEQVDDQRSMEECLSSEVVVAFRIWCTYDGQHFPVVIEYRGVKHPVPVVGYLFSVYEISLISILDASVCLFIDSAAENLLLEHFR